MRAISSPSAKQGFTLIEILVVIATLVVLAGLLLPALTKPKNGRGRINCISNLKQVGLAMRMFSNDHGDKFPWAVTKAEGGTMEYIYSTEVFRHFLAVSNELVTPKVLLCSSDLQRQRTGDWNSFSNTNLSYFAGLDADETRPQSILSGDRTLSLNGTSAVGFVLVRSNSNLQITQGSHAGAINIAFGDGSAQQLSASAARIVLQTSNALPMRLAIP
jgi:prepilin-type N-terminal cleavage/methylation domain-containing protein/prepilin-type processing-associated H-X9-DG protein